MGQAASYSALDFLREHETELGDHVESSLRTGLASSVIETSGEAARWYRRRLDWDSEYFGWPVIRLEYAAWDEDVPDPADALADVLLGLRRTLADGDGPRPYLFAEMPAAALEPIAALGSAGFRLIETRVSYFARDLAALRLPASVAVRAAGIDDIPHLRDVAASARNPFDRYHADPTYSTDVADAYLATYAEASVRGLADVVLVPAPHDGQAAGAFASGSMTSAPSCPLGLDHTCPLALSVGKIPLVGVSGARRGWHIGLVAEMTRLFADEGMDVAHMTTQISNRAVVRNCEKLGYRLGRATHVFATRA